ncbi:MAG: hypothetical protein AAGJ83_04910, partial [Planctomycetota bacterium]
APGDAGDRRTCRGMMVGTASAVDVANEAFLRSSRREVFESEGVVMRENPPLSLEIEPPEVFEQLAFLSLSFCDFPIVSE